MAACVIALCGSARAGAQAVFIGAGAFADAERFGHVDTRSPTIREQDPSGTVRRWFVTAGGKLAPHAVVLTEISQSSTLRKSFEPDQPVIPCPLCSVTRSSLGYRANSAAILGGYTSATKHHLAGAALAGVMFLAERVESRSITTYNIPPIGIVPPLPIEAVTTSYRLAPAFGFDVEISAGSHLSIGPKIRLYKGVGSSFGYPGITPPLGVQMGAGVQWRF